MNSPSPDEIMFLGVASSSPDGFPLAIGMGFPNTNQTQNILIRPPSKWNIFDPKNNPKDEIISKFRKKDLLSRGIAPEEVANLISSISKDRVVYSLKVKHDEIMLQKLRDVMTTKITLHSALALFHGLAGFKRAMGLTSQTKLAAEYYPRDPSDVRWLITHFHKCRGG